MINIKKQISKIDLEYSENEILLNSGLINLMLFEPLPYKNLIVDINIERESYSSTIDRKKFIPLYLQTFQAQKKKLKKILGKINDRKIKIYPIPEKKETVLFLQTYWKYDNSVSHKENIYRYAAVCFRKVINDTEEDIYILKHYPHVYSNYKDAYIGGNFNYRYENEVLTYDKVNILTDGRHHFMLHINNETSLGDKRAILNIFAFFNGCPNFEFLNNKQVNQKSDDLYQYFDLLDCIRLRHPNYLNSDTEKPLHLELPILKNKKHYK